MILKAEYSSAFNKDIKRIQKRGLDMSMLIKVVNILVYQRPLDSQYRDHALRGNWIGYRELHISFDWLLIYRYSSGAVYFARTGTHSELFNK